MRAKWKDCPITKLKAGQSFIGDWKKAGIHSEMAYRHAKTVLETCKLATFKGTNKGTVASLVTTGIFSVSAEQRNGPNNRPATDQGTGQQQAGNGQGTSNHTDTQKDGYTDHTDTTPPSPSTGAPPPSPPGKEKKKSDNRPSTPVAKKIADLYHRKHSTPWTAKEIRAFKSLFPIDPAELDLVCRYTEAERAKGDDGRHRRELGDGGEGCDTMECGHCEKEFTWARSFIVTYKGIPIDKLSGIP